MDREANGRLVRGLRKWDLVDHFPEQPAVGVLGDHHVKLHVWAVDQEFEVTEEGYTRLIVIGYKHRMARRAISVTLETENVSWLRGRAGAVGESVSEVLDQIVSAAPVSKSKEQGANAPWLIRRVPSPTRIR